MTNQEKIAQLNRANAELAAALAEEAKNPTFEAYTRVAYAMGVVRQTEDMM